MGQQNIFSKPEAAWYQARLAEKSASELSFRLHIGEATGDNRSEPDT